jgi:hypothetical protein
MGKWKWFLVKGSDFRGVISIMIEFLNQCQYDSNASVCLGIILKDYDTSAE